MENNNTKSVPKKRLEYIDAMRGFTMILVVVSHIYLYCMKSDITTPQNLNFYLIQCRMPLFFLVSGFVFYKCMEWKLQDILSFFKKKIMVQLVSPMIFLCLYAYMTHNNLVEALCDDYKLGYWFTFTLLEYYIIYVILYRICSCFNCSPRLFDVINIIVGILLTVFRFETLVDKLPFHTVASTLGILQISYYQFFVVGTIIKRNWTRVVSLLQNPKPIMIITGAYFIINIFAFEWADIQVVSKLISLLCSYLGVCIIFAFFYSNAEHFTAKKRVGRALQYVGRRTLDVYLLHFFLLPIGLNELFPMLTQNKYPIAEFLFCLCVAIIVLACSLVISRILRLSPLLAQSLFGTKLK